MLSFYNVGLYYLIFMGLENTSCYPVGCYTFRQRGALTVLTSTWGVRLYLMCASTNVGLELLSFLQIETFDDVPLLRIVSVKEAVNRLICWSKDYVVVNTRNITYKTISLHTWTYIRYLTMDQH